MSTVSGVGYLFLLLFSFAVTAGAERVILPKLKNAAPQPIYEEGPSWHKSKRGTPTMGGIAFLAAAAGILLICPSLFVAKGLSREAVSLLLTLGFAALSSLIGIFDDLKKLHKRENAGLSPKEKLLFQSLVSALFLAGRHFLLGDPTSVSLFGKTVELSFFYYPIAFLLLVFFVNAVNLTDGIDGLCSSVGYGAGCALLCFSLALSSPASAVSSALLVGATLAFLLFNLHPAKIFMGDTGSLFLGGLFSATVFSLRAPILFFSVGAVFLIEGASVLLQVFWFKCTHRRLFRMAPIHHALEKRGFSENRICLCALLLTVFFSAVGALTLA